MRCFWHTPATVNFFRWLIKTVIDCSGRFKWINHANFSRGERKQWLVKPHLYANKGFWSNYEKLPATSCTKGTEVFLRRTGRQRHADIGSQTRDSCHRVYPIHDRPHTDTGSLNSSGHDLRLIYWCFAVIFSPLSGFKWWYLLIFTNPKNGSLMVYGAK